MTRVWRVWVEWISHREAATTLALVRIALGLCTFATLVGVLPVIDLVWAASKNGGYRSMETPRIFAALGGTSPANVHGVTYAAIAASMAVIAGVGGRWPILLLQQLVYALFSLNIQSGGAHDRLLVNVLWICFLSQSTQTLSMDAKRRTGRWTDSTPVAAWPRYLLILQLVVMYGSSGLQKVSPEWWPIGRWSAVYYSLRTPPLARWDYPWLRELFPLTQVATAATMAFEIGAPLLLLWFLVRKLRPQGAPRWVRSLFVVVGVSMHLSLWFLMELGPFSPITLSLYLALFHPDEWHRRVRSALPTAGIA